VAGKLDRQLHVLDPWQMGAVAAHQGGQQHGQVPGAAEGQLQIGQLDSEHFLLDIGAVQPAVGLQSGANLDRQIRSKTPQQNLRQVVQQRGESDFLDVHVVPRECPVVCIVRCTLHPQDHLQDAQQGLPLTLQHRFEGECLLEHPEERVDAKHHHCAGNVRDVTVQVAVTNVLNIGQHTDGQQRILQNDVGDVATADLVDLLPCLVETARRLAQNRQFRSADKGQPACKVLWQGLKHGLGLFSETLVGAQITPLSGSQLAE
jgi:hypothetical protein